MTRMTKPNDVAARTAWIARPWIDLIVGCGGWSLPLLAVAYALSGDAARQWSGAFYMLALVANYPHYMATVYRAYGRADRSAHQRWTVYGTAALALLGVAAHLDVRLLPWLFTAYVMWSPWHYTGQNFGLLMMFVRRAHLQVEEATRRRLHVAFVASYVMLLASFNEGPSPDPLVLSLGLPADAARAVAVAAGLVFVTVGLMGFWPLWKQAPARALLAPAVLYLSQALWFVAPTALASLTGLAVPQTRYSSGILAVMHSLQYLWITQYFARREQGAGWSAQRYWLTLGAGGMALFLPVPWITSYVGHVDFTASMLIVTAIVNLHHFMIDGVVWKLRDARVARTLTTAPAERVESAESGQPAQPVFKRLAAGAAVAALVGLAAVDQWRYRLTSRESDAASLQEAIRLNPYDDAVQVRLLRALVNTGQNEAARAHLDQMLAARPDDVDALVNAGVLARRTGRPDDAARYWQRALDLDPVATHVQLYLAELRDEQGQADAAGRHYRMYLELVVDQRARVAPDPRVVIPVVLRFGDALERTGHAAEARGQFELAVRLARQTGLRDLEARARARLGAPVRQDADEPERK
jgi:tetratricopeptide (TPR) repeat protein